MKQTATARLGRKVLSDRPCETRSDPPARLMAERGLQRIELLEPLARLVARGVIVGIGDSASLIDWAIAAGSISAASVACSASTVRPVGDTSAKPPRTTMRCGAPSPWIVSKPGLSVAI